MRINRNTPNAALVGIWMVLLSAFVITFLYFGREILIPLALAIMITFLLSPLVARIERWIGRIAAVLIVVVMLFGIIGGIGWLLTRQVIDLAAKLPDYQTNIETKLHAIRLPKSGAFGRFTRSFNELQQQLPNAEANVAAVEEKQRSPQPAATPMPVRIVQSASRLPLILQTMAAGLLGPLGRAGLVILLVVFMLFKREDLRGRFIRLIGQGRIGATTRALDDAGKRVARYLGMQFLVNVTFGICVSVGLNLIGVPNAALWGAFAALMRFVPYIGVWIAAAVPVLLSFAVSSSWLAPTLVLAMFVGLELINANLLEPWLYGASTGVSSVALIIAAVFWTWLWGPIGLLLSTPLTVCLAVMGRHVSRLQFLSVLLSEDEALAPHEELYYRLLRLGLDGGSQLAEEFAKTNSVTALYDTVLIPAVTLAENDALRQQLDGEQRAAVQQHVHDIVEDLGSISPAQVEPPNEPNAEVVTPPTCSVLTLPARAYRDELAGAMFTQILQQQGFRAENAPAALSAEESIQLVKKGDWEAVCVSVVAPSTQTHARFVCTRVRATLPQAKIIVGTWGRTENEEIVDRLRAAGADEVVGSLAEAVAQLAKFCVAINDEMIPAPLPADEEERLTTLKELRLDDLPAENLDQITAKVARIFEVPIALVNLIEREQQRTKSAAGLPEDEAEAFEIPREQSVCGHVVASDQALIVEDIARDRRFANNPLLRERGLRFYAGVPLRVNEHAIGSLCILDTKPRRLSEREQRLLEIMADDVVEEIKRHANGQAANEAAAA